MSTLDDEEDKKMREKQVLILNPQPPPVNYSNEGFWGGIQRYCHNLGLALSKKNWKVTIIAPFSFSSILTQKSSEYWRFQSNPDFMRTEFGYYLYLLPYDSGKEVISRFLRRKKNAVVVMVPPGLPGRPSLEDLCSLASEFKNSKDLLLAVPFPKKEINFYLPSVFDNYMEKLSVLGEASDRIVFPSDFVKEEYRAVFDEKKNTIYQGVETPDRRSSSWKESVACVSRFGVWGLHKNHIPLIEALQLVLKEKKDLICYFAGAGSERLSYFVRKIQLDRNIKVLGHITEDKRISLIRRTSVFALPSALEAFGFSFVEALTSGVPIVACYDTAVPEISKGVGCFCHPRYASRYSSVWNFNENLAIEPSVEELASCILRALESRHKLSARSSEAAKGYSIENMAKNYGELIEGL